MTSAAPPPLKLTMSYDKRLTDVTRALDNLTRTDDGGVLASGAFDAFPLPIVRLADETSDLPLPLTPAAVDTIKRISSSSSDHSWAVKREDVELRNPHWRSFVDTIVESVRGPLGITDAAQLHTTLRELVLVETDGAFPTRNGAKGDSQKLGRFGSLVVVLPGQFTGGDMAITRALGEDSETQRWSPGRSDRDAFDVRYVAFCNDASRIETAPVGTGQVMCLVYDLETTTIHELPRYAGDQVLEDQVQTALANFFTVPMPQLKRVKISADAWRTITEFTTDRRLVYPVMARTFDDLEGTDLQLFEHLATFCARSNGQFGLYLAALGNCFWKKPKNEDGQATHVFNLGTPWYKHGHASELPFSMTKAQLQCEVLPAGFMEKVQHHQETYSEGLADLDYRYLASRYVMFEDGGCLCTLRQPCALVVQPATLETALWAEAPVEELVAKLDELVVTAPSDASRIVRRFLSNQPDWASASHHFTTFRAITVALGDPSLLDDLEQSARLAR